MIIKSIFIIPAILFSGIMVFAQKDIPSFGKVDKADLEMKQCSFDEAAEAVVLFDVAEVYCFLNHNSNSNFITTQFERRVRIKILNNKGLYHANIRIPFVSDNDIEEIKNLTAETINQDANGNIIVTKVDKNSIYIKKINTRFSEVVFAFPEVKAGSIIEYQYKEEAKWLYALKNWFFQKNIPIILSRYTLNFPPELAVSAKPKGILKVETTHNFTDGRDIKIFELKMVPAFKKEPFITSDIDYLQQVKPYLESFEMAGQDPINLLKKWKDIVNHLIEDEYFGVQLKKNIPKTSDLEAKLVNINDPYKRMVIIYDYIKKNIQWNEIDGIWALDGVRSAWKEKKGTTGEINLILVNLLKDAELDAWPILVSTRENGRINMNLADENQFNKVMAYVTIKDKYYVLDASNKHTPVQLIPLEVLYSDGLLIQKFSNNSWYWKSLSDQLNYFNNSIVIQANIDEKGIIQGDAIINSSHYSRLNRIQDLKIGKEKFIEKFYMPSENNITIDSFKVSNTDIDSLPLIQYCKFKQPVNSSGGFHYFSANLFSGLEKNPFLDDTRYSDVFFGARQLYTIDAFFTIPSGFSFDALPENMLMRLPDTSIVFSRYSSINENKLAVRIELEFKKPFYTAEEYDAFHEFYKKLFSLLNEQYVYKKD